jgi:hypothetical protein
MKWLTNMALCFAMGALCALVPISSAHAEIFGVKTVYLLPMAGGLDQYLALQLSSGGLLQVVTDPKKADAILTDGIGARLEDSLSELYGASVNKDPVDKDKSDKNKSDKDKSGNASTPDFSHATMRPLSSSRGLVFLVNRTSRDVLWSTYELPSSTQPEELKHVAEKIVERLAKANTKTTK